MCSSVNWRGTLEGDKVGLRRASDSLGLISRAGQNDVAADLDFKSPHRLGCRHAERFAGAGVKAGAVAGAGDFAAVERTVGQRLPVVRADVFDREKVVADVEQEGGCFVDHNGFAVGGLPDLTCGVRPDSAKPGRQD